MMPGLNYKEASTFHVEHKWKCSSNHTTNSTSVTLSKTQSSIEERFPTTKTTAQLSSSGMGDLGHDRSKLLARGRFQLSCGEDTSRTSRQKETSSNKIQIFLHSLCLLQEEKNKCTRGEDELASVMVGKNENESTRVSNSQLSIPDVNEGAWKHTNTTHSLAYVQNHTKKEQKHIKLGGKMVDERGYWVHIQRLKILSFSSLHSSHFLPVYLCSFL